MCGDNKTTYRSNSSMTNSTRCSPIVAYCCCVLAHKNLIVTLYNGSLSMGNNICII